MRNVYIFSKSVEPTKLPLVAMSTLPQTSSSRRKRESPKDKDKHEKPYLKVNYHVKPSVVCKGMDVTATCSALVGTEGGITWALEEKPKKAGRSKREAGRYEEALDIREAAFIQDAKFNRTVGVKQKAKLKGEVEFNRKVGPSLKRAWRSRRRISKYMLQTARFKRGVELYEGAGINQDTVQNTMLGYSIEDTFRQGKRFGTRARLRSRARLRMRTRLRPKARPRMRARLRMMAGLTKETAVYNAEPSTRIRSKQMMVEKDTHTGRMSPDYFSGDERKRKRFDERKLKFKQEKRKGGFKSRADQVTKGKLDARDIRSRKAGETEEDQTQIRKISSPKGFNRKTRARRGERLHRSRHGENMRESHVNKRDTKHYKPRRDENWQENQVIIRDTKHYRSRRSEKVETPDTKDNGKRPDENGQQKGMFEATVTTTDNLEQSSDGQGFKDIARSVKHIEGKGPHLTSTVSLPVNSIQEEGAVISCRIWRPPDNVTQGSSLDELKATGKPMTFLYPPDRPRHRSERVAPSFDNMMEDFELLITCGCHVGTKGKMFVELKNRYEEKLEWAIDANGTLTSPSGTDLKWMKVEKGTVSFDPDRGPFVSVKIYFHKNMIMDYPFLICRPRIPPEIADMLPELKILIPLDTQRSVMGGHGTNLPPWYVVPTVAGALVLVAINVAAMKRKQAKTNLAKARKESEGSLRSLKSDTQLVSVHSFITATDTHGDNELSPSGINIVSASYTSTIIGDTNDELASAEIRSQNSIQAKPSILRNSALHGQSAKSKNSSSKRRSIIFETEV